MSCSVSVYMSRWKDSAKIPFCAAEVRRSHEAPGRHVSVWHPHANPALCHRVELPDRHKDVVHLEFAGGEKRRQGLAELGVLHDVGRIFREERPNSSPASQCSK